MSSFPADAFKGTAEYYAKYRVPYPQPLIDDLLARAKLSTPSCLIDLGCGPGRVTLRLAPCFDKTIAIDLEPEMVEAGEKEAEKLGVGNIEWRVGKAEDLSVPSASVDLISIGEAFHRFDQARILALAMKWLKPVGCLAVIGAFSILGGRSRWQQTIREVVGEFTGEELAERKEKVEFSKDEDAMKSLGFIDVESYGFSVPYTWKMESVIGNLYSTSICSRKGFGNRIDDFEKQLSDKLLLENPNDEFPETVEFGYTIARKPIE